MTAVLALALLAAGAARAVQPRICGVILAFGLWSMAYGHLWADLAWIALGAALCLGDSHSDERRERPSGVALTLLAVAGAAAAVLFVATLRASPDGGWDAFMIWNLRARMFPAGAAAFDPVLHHVDYPLLLSQAVARTGSPIAVAAGFALACAAALWALVRRAAGAEAACLATALLLATPAFASVAAWQYADVPLATFVLVAAGLAASGNFVAAGVAAGLAAWTKNEGLLLLACLAVAVLWKSRRGLLLFAAGAVPLLAVVVAFKLSRPPNDIVAGAALHASRWATVAKGFLLRPFSPLHWGLGWIFVFAAARQRFHLAIVILALAGYFAVYLATPLPLEWHLENSADRLWLHLYPAALLAASQALARNSGATVPKT